MLTLGLIIILLAVAGVGYSLGLNRVRNGVRAGEVRAHSRVGYYGTYVGLWAAVPSLLLLFAWSSIEPIAIEAMVTNDLPQEVREQPPEIVGLAVNQIRNVAADQVSTDGLEQYVLDAAAQWNSLEGVGRVLMIAVVFGFAAAGLGLGYTRVEPQLRARNAVERVVKIALIICSSIAILTTIGIVMSLVVEAGRFFSMVPFTNFFFGLEWSPRFSGAGVQQDVGQFGLIPILWGTLFISAIALSVAVPIGLLSAIYLSEYAGPKLRSVAKPMIEILAGIPTVVYGFFALITVGPLLRDWGATIGLDIDASSALTAGLVMGVMIIPFVSSLSDDIINAVPQSLRDGSYGLGATKSETIRIVIMPAALPGIVGAVLLAASRAIGETMIVVMAAGVAANLTVNPFEKVTTVTVMIVKQLTGDAEFTSPQSLVAFALGITLFTITLGLNVFALYIVRKYREQYD